MTNRSSLLALVAVALACLTFASSAQSQVVVYSVEFKKDSGFNLEFFDGGYFVAPALGGEGTSVSYTHLTLPTKRIV